MMNDMVSRVSFGPEQRKPRRSKPTRGRHHCARKGNSSAISQCSKDIRKVATLVTRGRRIECSSDIDILDSMLCTLLGLLETVDLTLMYMSESCSHPRTQIYHLLLCHTL